jgi:peptidoglycan hydrolase-like protein with peptidoglycan-binding domain
MSLHTSLHLISTLALLVLASIAIVFFTPSAHANTAQCVVPITMGMAFGSRDASTGNQVSALQRFLASDSTLYPEGEITGYFGPATQRAVQRFQARYGIVSSGTPSSTGYGSVGALTRAVIDRLCDSDHEEDDTEDEDEDTDIESIDEIIVYINKDTKKAEVSVVINGGSDLTFGLSYSSKTRAITFIGEKLESAYDFDFSEFKTDRKRNDALKRLIEWEYEEEDEDEDVLTVNDIRKITVTENGDGEYVDVVVDQRDGDDPEFDVVAERESKVVTAIAEKLENSFEFDFDDYRSDRTRDRDLAKLITWVEYDGDVDAELEISGTMYGGCAMGPNGCPKFTLEGTKFTYTSKAIMTCLALTCPKVGTLSGTISNTLSVELIETLTPQTLSSNAKTNTSKVVACRSYVDGTDYVYVIERDGVSYTLDTCKTQLANNSALQALLKEIWDEVQEVDEPDDSDTLTVSMSPRSGLVQGDSVTLTWPKTAVESNEGMYVVLRTTDGSAIASKRITDPKSGTYTYTIPSASDFCNNFFSDALGTCGEYAKKKTGAQQSFILEIATFTPSNACFGYCAPNSAKAVMGQTAKTASFTLGGSAESDAYDISDIKSVVTKYVDPIVNAADDEYTLYTITLKNSKKVTVRGCGFCTREMFERAFTNSGYTGDVDDLLDLAVADEDDDEEKQATPFDAGDIKKVSSVWYNPVPSTTTDDYALYTITLKDGSVRNAKVYFGTSGGVGQYFEKIGYDGSPWTITNMASISIGR